MTDMFFKKISRLVLRYEYTVYLRSHAHELKRWFSRNLVLNLAQNLGIFKRKKLSVLGDSYWCPNVYENLSYRHINQEW